MIPAIRHGGGRWEGRTSINYKIGWKVAMQRATKSLWEQNQWNTTIK